MIKMQEKIRNVKETLEMEEKKVLVMSSIDKPNAEGKTLLHISTSEDFDETTEASSDPRGKSQRARF